MDHLVGSRELELMLGVSRQRIQVLVNRPDFPEPQSSLAMGKVWDRGEVVAWARAHDREVS